MNLEILQRDMLANFNADIGVGYFKIGDNILNAGANCSYMRVVFPTLK